MFHLWFRAPIHKYKKKILQRKESNGINKLTWKIRRVWFAPTVRTCSSDFFQHYLVRVQKKMFFWWVDNVSVWCCGVVGTSTSNGSCLHKCGLSKHSPVQVPVVRKEKIIKCEDDRCLVFQKKTSTILVLQVLLTLYRYKYGKYFLYTKLSSGRHYLIRTKSSNKIQRSLFFHPTNTRAFGTKRTVEVVHVDVLVLCYWYS